MHPDPWVHGAHRGPRALTHSPRFGLFPWVQPLAVTRMSMCLLIRVYGGLVRAFKRRRGARNVTGMRPGESRWGSYDTHAVMPIMHSNDYGRAKQGFYRHYSGSVPPPDVIETS